MEEAIRLAEEVEGYRPKEGWYVLLAACFSELKDKKIISAQYALEQQVGIYKSDEKKLYKPSHVKIASAQSTLRRWGWEAHSAYWIAVNHQKVSGLKRGGPIDPRS